MTNKTERVEIDRDFFLSNYTTNKNEKEIMKIKHGGYEYRIKLSELRICNLIDNKYFDFKFLTKRKITNKKDKK